MHRREIIFIELDGATWDVMDPLMKSAKLPNMQGLMENGVHGELISDYPYISPRLWTSIFSGKKAQKHGVKFFGGRSEEVLCKRIWDILDQKGVRVGLFGSLVTWPPRPINGFVIPSVFALGPETYPEEFQFFQRIILGERKKLHQTNNIKTNAMWANLSYLKELLINGIGLGTQLRIGSYLFHEKLRGFGQGDKYWRKACLQLRMSTDMFVKLYRKYAPCFSTFHIHLCDAVSHRYWEFYQPDKFPEVDNHLAQKFAGVIPEAYITSDKMIGKILSLKDETTTIIVASDHGFMALSEPPINPFVLDLNKLLEILHIGKQAIPAKFGMETFLYFNNPVAMGKMAGVIKGVKFSETRESVFEARIDGEYLGFRVPQSKWKIQVNMDTLIDFGSYGEFNFWDLFSQKSIHISGKHARKGVLIMNGPAIRQNMRLEDPSIFDLTPTILFLMGLAAARDMDGRILTDAIEEIFISQHKIEVIDSYEDAEPKEISETRKLKNADYEKLKERLQSLGYL